MFLDPFLSHISWIGERSIQTLMSIYNTLPHIILSNAMIDANSRLMLLLGLRRRLMLVEYRHLIELKIKREKK